MLEIFACKGRELEGEGGFGGVDGVVGENDIDEKWSNDTWQYTCLMPLCELLAINPYKDSLNKNLERIIKQVGLNIHSSGWKIILFYYNKYINDSKQNEQTIWLCLKPLRYIVESYLLNLDEDNRIMIIGILCRLTLF